ncbi:rhodanese-like domain-containing protein [Caballeronia sp. DA-9]|uniref:rhodanese-like domain-containing protein n=1 Tax=Caballeronia sp. DA-9 TaxID=3436237 RepID=UPI003F66DF87
MSIRHIHRATLQTWLTEGGLGTGNELALLDLRSVEAFAKGHPLFATNLPLENLERGVQRFVPRKSVRLVLVDDGDNAAELGAAILEGLGYTDINILNGGIPAWTADGLNGLPTFDIPGIIFSESVRDLRGTPSIEAEQLKKLYDAKENVIVIDTRTRDEFARGHVPGAVNAPGEEILYRFLDQVPNPDTFVVVSCAGLPRAIIGAQTLIDAQVPNRVAFLKDGTAGWTRATLELATGGEKRAPTSSGAAAFGIKHAQALGEREKIRTVNQQGVEAWLADTTKRTTYLLDIRSAEEYEAGHVAGSISAPGGQLLAVSHRTVATRGARLVLIDDDGTRAVTTAYWLQQRGWEVHLLENASSGASTAPLKQVPELLNS